MINSDIDIQINQGEQLSFFQLFAEKQWKIEIPIIQRDYAQGRNSAIGVRNNFLDSLLNHLQDNKNIDLDFVYGSINGEANNLFIPLDGQQRLTTLFLLHWYLATHDEKFEDFKSFITTASKSNFTYETRTSAREFCNALVNAEINLSHLIKDSISITIMDKAWYFGSWDNDPTIKAMLNMLDAIHEKFKATSNLYERLTHSEKPVITFQFLNLKKFSLTDDLYIKMNARGKQLTDFENFKAKFEQQIKNAQIEKVYELSVGNTTKEVTAHEYFSHKIDTEWADLFWNYKAVFKKQSSTNKQDDDNTFDDEIMNFIRLVITNHYAIVGQGHNKVNNTQMLIGRDNDDNNLTYLQYKELNCLDEKLITDLIAIFDLLKNGEKTIKVYSGESTHFNEADVFKLALLNKTGYRDKIRFYAFYRHLILFGATEGLHQWMRVVYNLTENFIYNRPEEYIRSIQAIEEILPKSNKILEHLSNPANKLSGFPDVQIHEERIKANLICKGDTGFDAAWFNAIQNLENHEYFTGQIGFCLNFAGIEEYFNNNSHCNWDKESNAEYLELFKVYSEKAKAIFNNDGLIQLPSHLWHRALLSKGDYLLNKGSNWSFLINDERDISWKRLLRDNNEDRRDFVKQLFDDSDFSIANIQESLNTIIDKSTVSNWREFFIKTPEVIQYLGFNKFIRWESKNEIYLLRKKRLSGEHAEYYSYAFYNNYLKNNIPAPFTNSDYYSPSGNENIPCAYVDNWLLDEANYAMDIRYLHHEDQSEIRFFNRESDDIYDSIVQILEDHHMTQSDKYEDNSYLISHQNEEEVIEFITKIGLKLQKIQ
ncbi:DUF262 domain-containing protein [Prolixibacteraceae bacterium JC049]|nr:DUF262 domain-containing protein [Prolixibacteraceae bacterium JC049]